MIERSRHVRNLLGLLSRHRVVAILGARQVGKTTLARRVVAGWDGPATYFDLEKFEDVARLDDPMLALGGRRGLIVLDEIQRRPDLFPALRVLADRRPAPARFLVLGSASPELLRQSSESLAGRIVFQELHGFSADEVGAANLERLWARGGFPRSYTARTIGQSAEWRRAFVQTFLERDLPASGLSFDGATMRRLWTMLAHYHGQIWNASEFARSFGVSDTTIRRYLDALTSTFVVRQLLPWHENLGKRQVKSPKVFIADPGLLHTLLNLQTVDEIERHPKAGASWEGFAMSEVVSRLGARREECFFWATHAGAEIDLLVVRGRHRYGFEFKRTVAPRVTPSMTIASRDLRLTHLDVIHAGRETYPMARGIRALPLARILSGLRRLK